MNDFRETLYTIDKRGHRKWVYAASLAGFWRIRRAIIAYLLMLFYLSLPWISFKGQQAVWFDFANRKFIFFGNTFWATDTIFVVLILAGLAFSLFFFSALLGRVWCGWACPETVFLEFLFRPIERLIEGSPAQRLRLDQQPWTIEKIIKKLSKHVFCAFFAWIIASTAIAYIIGREPLLNMMLDWPWNNLVPFTLTLIMMGLMAFQFGWFREQFCTILCPYARFQSALLDVHSLIVGYDAKRGEPRGKLKKNEPADQKGDCIDCGLCVRVCPTGIDIRNGTQLECIHCTACIDACDSIMTSINKPTGLIRYDSEQGLSGQTRTIIRPRLFVYIFLLVVIFSTFIYQLNNRSLTDFQVLRAVKDNPYSLTPDGAVVNHLNARVGNKDRIKQVYQIRVSDSAVQLITAQSELIVESGTLVTAPIFVKVPAKILVLGKYKVDIELIDSKGNKQVQQVTVLGPG